MAHDTKYNTCIGGFCPGYTAHGRHKHRQQKFHMPLKFAHQYGPWWFRPLQGPCVGWWVWKCQGLARSSRWFLFVALPAPVPYGSGVPLWLSIWHAPFIWLRSPGRLRTRPGPPARGPAQITAWANGQNSGARDERRPRLYPNSRPLSVACPLDLALLPTEGCPNEGGLLKWPLLFS